MPLSSLLDHSSKLTPCHKSSFFTPYHAIRDVKECCTAKQSLYSKGAVVFSGTARKEDRSIMNVPFVTGDAKLDAEFIKEAAKHNIVNTKGHRSIGGMRASLYNAMPQEGVQALVDFMEEFESQHK